MFAMDASLLIKDVSDDNYHVSQLYYVKKNSPGERKKGSTERIALYFYKPKSLQKAQIKFADDQVFSIEIQSIISTLVNRHRIIIPKNESNKFLYIKQLPINKHFLLNNIIKCEIIPQTKTIIISVNDIADLLYYIFTENIWISAIGMDDHNICLYTNLILQDGKMVQFKISINKINHIVECSYQDINIPQKNAIEVKKKWDFTTNIIDYANVLELHNAFLTLIHYKTDDYYQEPVIIHVVDKVIGEILYCLKDPVGKK